LAQPGRLLWWGHGRVQFGILLLPTSRPVPPHSVQHLSIAQHHREVPRKDENRTKISQIEPHRFLYFIRLNSYFCVRFYCFHFRFYFRISNKKVENSLDIFRPFFDLVANHYCPGN
jgi:hypothetical protein